MVRWFIDGNNVMGSRPDGWWNDRASATRRLAQQIAEWCRTHDDEVIVVFDRPLDDRTAQLAGGNLTVESARRSGRDAADDRIVELATDSTFCHPGSNADELDEDGPVPRTDDDPGFGGRSGDPTGGGDLAVTVVTSDRGLIGRLPEHVTTMGSGTFLDVIGQGRRR